MRALRTTAVVLVVLAGLFVAADRLAVHLAEERAADQIMRARGLTGAESASVSIHGFPFLTQLASRELDEVEVRLNGMSAGAGDRRITVTRVDARFTRVLFEDGLSSASAGSATGTARVSYEDLNRIAPDGVRVSYAGPDRAGRNQVRLTATVSVLGREITLPQAIHSTVSLTEDGRVRLRADSVPGGGIPGAERQVRDRVDFGSAVRGLPAGLKLDATNVTEDGITFTLRGKDVKLAG